MTRRQLKQLATAPRPKIELGEKSIREDLYKVEQVFKDSSVVVARPQQSARDRITPDVSVVTEMHRSDE